MKGHIKKTNFQEITIMTQNNTYAIYNPILTMKYMRKTSLKAIVTDK